MNHDTIAKLIDAQMEAYYNGDYMDSSDAKGQLSEFANLVAAATRAQCAQVCASMNWDGRSDIAIAMGDAADECAAAIRAMEVK